LVQKWEPSDKHGVRIDQVAETYKFYASLKWYDKLNEN
jgi:hypothetical protein